MVEVTQENSPVYGALVPGRDGTEVDALDVDSVGRQIDDRDQCRFSVPQTRIFLNLMISPSAEAVIRLPIMIK
jgi:hypothetical protein